MFEGHCTVFWSLMFDLSKRFRDWISILSCHLFKMSALILKSMFYSCHCRIQSRSKSVNDSLITELRTSINRGLQKTLSPFLCSFSIRSVTFASFLRKMIGFIPPDSSLFYSFPLLCFYQVFFCNSTENQLKLILQECPEALKTFSLFKNTPQKARKISFDNCHPDANSFCSFVNW